MTTLVLQAADTAVAAAVQTGTAWLGRGIADAIGGTGAHGGVRFVEGPRLSGFPGLSSQEGAPIPRLYGRARLGGQLVWATRFEEVAQTSVGRGARTGGKGFGGGRAPATVTTSFAYVANLAVALCEGPIAFVRRIWADGREIDQTGLTIRVHDGGDDQQPDPLIVAKRMRTDRKRQGAPKQDCYRARIVVHVERRCHVTPGRTGPQGPHGVRKLGPQCRSSPTAI